MPLFLATEVSKRGEWKTIEQRERSAASARKTQRRGQTAVTTGALMAGGAYATGSNGNLGDYAGNRALKEAKSLRTTGRYLRQTQPPLKSTAKIVGNAVRNRPLGAALIGGAGLAGVGSLGMFQGAAREGYQQNRINSRRKSNYSRVGKRAPMDHEGSGYARYGNYSGKGKRLEDEFAKEPVAKRVRNKDAESDRQRRLGAATAATGIGSALLLRRGIGGAVKATRNLRDAKLTTGSWNKASDDVKSLFHHADKDGKKVPGRGVVLTRRQIAQLGGGTAMGGGSIAISNHARSERNHRWE